MGFIFKLVEIIVKAETELYVSQSCCAQNEYRCVENLKSYV